MKIGILGTRGIPNNYGGFEQFAAFLAPELVKRGHTVAVYNSQRHPYQQKEWKGVQIIHCNDPERRWGTIGQFMYDRNCNADARKQHFDVLFHFGYSSDSIGWRGWPKNTVNIVNMDGLEWKRTKYNHITRKFLRKAESLAANHAHALVADSKAMEDYLLKTYQKPAVYIPYAAAAFSEPDPTVLNEFKVIPCKYFLLIARMEPENNIEMVINGYLLSGHQYPLLIIGNTGNRTGQYLKKRYQHPRIFFAGAVFDDRLLNNIRYYSALYFHGHSVGGTNPSLLEAMACSCLIAAHSNPFNRAVTGEAADYFASAAELAGIIKNLPGEAMRMTRLEDNLEKIRMTYNPQKIVDDYEQLALASCIR